ncbi:MAG: heavy-metal-associated domain-containing protein [Betaproteobacteria bacterium]|nr:heavy-metal-associated domain-containing protein [Betaproteobacteria bacterium]
MQTVTLGISGMTCGGCVRSVTRVLDGLEGVAKSDVSLEKRCAVVDYDPGKLGVEQLKRAIVEAGYEVAP